MKSSLPTTPEPIPATNEIIWDTELAIFPKINKFKENYALTNSKLNPLLVEIAVPDLDTDSMAKNSNSEILASIFSTEKIKQQTIKLTTELQEEIYFTKGMSLTNNLIDSGYNLLGFCGTRLPKVSQLFLISIIGEFLHKEPIKLIDRINIENEISWQNSITTIRHNLLNFNQLPLKYPQEWNYLFYLMGLLYGSTLRKTPVFIDSLPLCVAALMAEKKYPGITKWIITTQSQPNCIGYELILKYLSLPVWQPLFYTENSGLSIIHAQAEITSLIKLLNN